MSRASTPELPPVIKTITVCWPPEAAFRHFTAGIAAWWPLRTHSVGQDRAESVVLEGRVGGRVYERIRGGEESTWGTVTVWDPPHRIALTWHPGREPDSAQEVEVRFHAAGSGTRLELTHSGWERLGALAPRARRGYELGWGYVLRLWAGRRFHPAVLATDLLLLAMRPFRGWLERRAKRLEERESPS